MSIDTLGLDSAQRQLFDESLKLLDNNFAPPLLWGSAKLSSWYAVALLARRGPIDVARANALIHNLLTQQDVDAQFEQNYGSFRKGIFQPLSSGPKPLWVTEVRVIPSRLRERKDRREATCLAQVLTADIRLI
jgi:hypothetical protein